MTGNVDEINNPYRNIEQMYMINNNSETYLKNNVNYLNKYYNSLPSISEQNIIVPIPLWFSRNKGLNLPFHALNQDIIIRMQIELKAIKDLYTISSIEEIDLSSSMDEDGNTIDHSLDKKILSNGFEKWNNNKIYKLNTIKPFKIEHEFKKFIKSSLNQWNLSPTLLVDYIFLEPETSKKIKKENRQFFIDKVIKSEHLGNIGEVTIKPELYHPSKEIIFNIKRSDMIDINNHSNYTNFDDESFTPIADRTISTKGAGIEPIMLSSFVDFMLAETALVNSSLTGDAASYLESAITKSIDKVTSFRTDQVDSNYASSNDDIDNYVAEIMDRFNSSSSDEKMNVIAKEYFKALWGNGVEAFNTYRRTGKPSDLQELVREPVTNFLRSFYYPDNYVLQNTNAEQKSDVTDKVFWDNNPDNGFIK